MENGEISKERLEHIFLKCFLSEKLKHLILTWNDLNLKKETGEHESTEMSQIWKNKFCCELSFLGWSKNYFILFFFFFSQLIQNLGEKKKKSAVISYAFISLNEFFLWELRHGDGGIARLTATNCLERISSIAWWGSCRLCTNLPVFSPPFVRGVRSRVQT